MYANTVLHAGTKECGGGGLWENYPPENVGKPVTTKRDITQNPFAIVQAEIKETIMNVSDPFVLFLFL